MGSSRLTCTVQGGINALNVDGLVEGGCHGSPLVPSFCVLMEGVMIILQSQQPIIESSPGFFDWVLTWLDLNIIAAGVLSATIAIVSIFIGEWRQRRRDHEKENAKRRIQTAQLASSLHAELESLWNVYYERSGKIIQSAKKWTDVGTAVVSTGYFSVFDGNTAKLGLFTIEDVQVIVSAYIAAKSQADNIRTWSQTLTMLLQNKLTAVTAGTDAGVAAAGTLDNFAAKDMPENLDLLKQAHNDLKEKIESAMQVLKKYSGSG